jgi:hypothetical protein
MIVAAIGVYRVKIWGSGGIAPRHYIGVNGQLLSPAALLPGKAPAEPIG